MLKRSAGALILKESRGELYILALAGRNSWDLPKGGIEDNEDSFEAAQRELAEEAGVTKVCWLVKEPFEVRYDIGKYKKVVYFYLGITKHAKVTISNEHESYRWFSLCEAKDYLPKRFHSAVDWIRSYLVPT